jgi:adenylate cyclase
MNTEEFKRKLTAILSADVEGYSRLMGDDEDATIRTLTSYRELMSTLIQKHRGRVVDSPGDNLLAEFSSVVDAVRCAVEIQEELRIRNAELPENRKMHFRIGINLGDVVEEGDRIYGDGINIAARVEGLAEGGGICISGTVYDSIKNKLSLSYESLGEHTVKNIKEPVRVYRMRIGPEAAAPVVKDKKARLKKWQWAAIAAVVILIIGTVVVWNSDFRPPPIEPASTENMAFPLPKKPSIAVLPFDNMSGDPEQEYIADGISENLITALSNIPQFFVIARNSTFSYKGKSVKIKQVSEDLGVRYVVEGSIQKEGDRVRIIAQLIDSLKGNHIWSEKYDRQMEGLFDLLDDIAKNIASALHVELVTGLPDTRCAESLEVWDYTMKALDLNRHLTKENLIKARELLDQALKLEPQNVCVLVVLSYNHLLDFRYGFSESPADSFKLGVETAKKALALFEEKSSVQLLMAYVYFLQKQIDKAIISAKKAISIEPNYADAYSAWGGYLLRSGYPEEGIGKIKKAMRLNPYYPPSYLLTLARLSLIAGRYDEAIDANKMLLERAKKGEFNLFFPHLLFAEIYAEVGQEDKAQSHAAEVLKINPKFSVSDWGKTQFYKDPADLERRLKALRKAGLPDEPPLPLPDKPSIAVLPFDNLSADPDQEYFADGMTEDLITDLSKIAGLFVIARHSTFQYKGKAVDIKLVSRELGVRYVLEGSVRKAYGKVRINAQLIDSKTGGHVWAERYAKTSGAQIHGQRERL